MFMNKLMAVAIVAVLAAGIFIVSDGQDNEKVGLMEKEYTVTFHPNGGSCDQRTKTVIYGEPYGTLPIPTNGVDYFLGWFTDPESGTQVTEGTIYDTEGDTMVYAHWMTQYRITYQMFNPEAVNDYRNPICYNREMGFFHLYPATLPGATFNGWYIDEQYTLGPFEDIDTSCWHGDCTFYAKW